MIISIIIMLMVIPIGSGQMNLRHFSLCNWSSKKHELQVSSVLKNLTCHQSLGKAGGYWD